MNTHEAKSYFLNQIENLPIKISVIEDSLHYGIKVPDALYINVINLPKDLESCGAEKENNRVSFWIDGFGKDKVKVTCRNSVFRKKFRAKTGNPEKVMEYLADWIKELVNEVPYHFTHTRLDK